MTPRPHPADDRNMEWLDKILLEFAYTQAPEGISDQELIKEAKTAIAAHIKKERLALIEQFREIIEASIDS